MRSWRLEPVCQYPRLRPAEAVQAHAQAVATVAYQAIDVLPFVPQGAFVTRPFVIGKPTHATGLQPGTRMEDRAGRTTYICTPELCGERFLSLGKIRDHVQRTEPTRYYPKVCGVILDQQRKAREAKQAALVEAVHNMTDEQLAAALERLRAPVAANP
jgi:hypothetical protein